MRRTKITNTGFTVPYDRIPIRMYAAYISRQAFVGQQQILSVEYRFGEWSHKSLFEQSFIDSNENVIIERVYQYDPYLGYHRPPGYPQESNSWKRPTDTPSTIREQIKTVRDRFKPPAESRDRGSEWSHYGVQCYSCLTSGVNIVRNYVKI